MMLVKIGWDTQVLLPIKEAVALAEMLAKAYAWEEKRDGGDTLYYAYPSDKHVTMQLLNEELVDMAKLAGKPERAKLSV